MYVFWCRNVYQPLECLLCGLYLCFLWVFFLSQPHQLFFQKASVQPQHHKIMHVHINHIRPAFLWSALQSPETSMVCFSLRQLIKRARNFRQRSGEALAISAERSSHLAFLSDSAQEEHGPHTSLPFAFAGCPPTHAIVLQWVLSPYWEIILLRDLFKKKKK